MSDPLSGGVVVTAAGLTGASIFGLFTGTDYGVVFGAFASNFPRCFCCLPDSDTACSLFSRFFSRFILRWHLRCWVGWFKVVVVVWLQW